MNKYFLVLALLFVMGLQYLLLPSWYRGLGIKTEGWFVIPVVAISIILSAWVINMVLRKINHRVNRHKQYGAYIGGYGIFPFAVIVGFIVGGNFGGAIGSQLLDDIGVVIGLGVGVLFVTSFIGVVGAMLGYCLEEFVRYLLQR